MLLLLVLAFALSGHWLACLWYAIGLSGSCVDGVSQNSSWLNSFSYELRGVRFEFDETCKLLEPPDAGLSLSDMPTPIYQIFQHCKLNYTLLHYILS